MLIRLVLITVDFFLLSSFSLRTQTSMPKICWCRCTATYPETAIVGLGMRTITEWRFDLKIFRELVTARHSCACLSHRNTWFRWAQALAVASVFTTPFPHLIVLFRRFTLSDWGAARTRSECNHSRGFSILPPPQCARLAGHQNQHIRYRKTVCDARPTKVVKESSESVQKARRQREPIGVRISI